MADTSLVVESGQAKHCQAQLTRLQMALGLKQDSKHEGNVYGASISGSSADCDFKDLKSLAYGQKVPAIEPGVPTGFVRKGNVILMSLELVVKYDEGMLTYITWAVRSFDTALLKDASPKDYIQALHKSRTFGANWDSSTRRPKRGLHDITLGGVRRAIMDAFEPICLDHCVNSVHENDSSEHTGNTTLDLQICNPRRDVCDDEVHNNDQNNYDHTLHKTCKPRRNIILLLPKKESCLRHLEALGCDLFKHLHIVDIISVRELYQAFLVRQDYNLRHPMTGDHRTNIKHDWEDLSTDHQIWATFGYDTPGSGSKPLARNSRTLLQLKAAVDIATKDAFSTGWLRTLEHIEGGPFPGPWLKFHKRSDVEAFLVEYDVARASPISHSTLKTRVKALVESLLALNRKAYDKLIEELAQTHNYTHLLQIRFEAPSDDSSAASTNGSKNIPNVAILHKVAETDSKPLSQVSSTLVKPSGAVSSAVAIPTLPCLAKGAELDEKTQAYCRQYHRDQEALEKELRDAPVRPEDKKTYDSLFDWKPYADQRGWMKVTPITSGNYPQVFAILSRNKGWTMGPNMAKVLRGAIYNREKAREWYQRLPMNDPRRSEDDGHDNFLKVLKEGEAMLLSQSS